MAKSKTITLQDVTYTIEKVQHTNSDSIKITIDGYYQHQWAIGTVEHIIGAIMYLKRSKWINNDDMDQLLDILIRL